MQTKIQGGFTYDQKAMGIPPPFLQYRRCDPGCGYHTQYKNRAWRLPSHQCSIQYCSDQQPECWKYHFCLLLYRDRLTIDHPREKQKLV